MLAGAWGDFRFGGKTFQIEVGRGAQTHPTFETISVIGKRSQILVGLGARTHPTFGTISVFGETLLGLGWGVGSNPSNISNNFQCLRRVLKSWWGLGVTPIQHWDDFRVGGKLLTCWCGVGLKRIQHLKLFPFLGSVLKCRWGLGIHQKGGYCTLYKATAHHTTLPNTTFP